ncbi:MAG: hypothetical protein GY896_18515 [Gammaproteobacteria bacterium]|nr:hypothetical protein [Gammaproteobacteria bacterium]MCP4877458.1 hypothetical protein [Gammaproteobacteria bacterium]MCP4981804.1 hypothetical protein [Gammaproteobacteria bacterium]
MSVESSIEKTTESIISALATHDLSEPEKEQINKIVSQLLVKTVEKTTENHQKAAANCCGPEKDLAHQISEEMSRKKELLISNLKAMR